MFDWINNWINLKKTNTALLEVVKNYKTENIDLANALHAKNEWYGELRIEYKEYVDSTINLSKELIDLKKELVLLRMKK